MSFLTASKIWSAKSNNSPTADQRGTASIFLGSLQRERNFFCIMAIYAADNLPAICLKSTWRIISEPTLNVPINGNTVVVI